MKILVPFFAVLALILIPYIGTGSGGNALFGIIIPYAALLVFILGVINKVISWAKSPVPFRIPTTCGRGKSMPWIKHEKLDNPSTTLGVVVRMALEVLLFRSLFRNTKVELGKDASLAYGTNKWLWIFTIIFHYSFLVVVLRHYRFFLEPVPAFVKNIEAFDGFFQILVPTFYLTSIGLMAGVCFLLLRRFTAQIRYISLPADYFPLFLILSIATTGVLMRYIYRVDIVAIKEVVRGLVTFSPNSAAMARVGVIFYIHLFLVCVLAMVFPFSKLMHMGGVFLSSTRNMASNNREVRHINPWNPDMKTRTYAEYEDEFREKMKKAGLPLEKE